MMRTRLVVSKRIDARRAERLKNDIMRILGDEGYDLGVFAVFCA